jgi:hypothetical protein
MAAADMEAEIFGGGDNAENNAGQAHDDGLPAEFASMGPDDIARRARLLDNEVRVLRDEATRLNLEQANLTEKVGGETAKMGGGKDNESNPSSLFSKEGAPRLSMRAAALAKQKNSTPTSFRKRRYSKPLTDQGKQGKGQAQQPAPLPRRQHRRDSGLGPGRGL